MSCYKDLEELLRERAKTALYKTPTSAASGPKVDAYINFSPKGVLSNTNTLSRFGPREGERNTLWPRFR